MTTRRTFLGGIAAALFGGGCANKMGIFTFDDGLTQQEPVGGTWTPGDPWADRTTTTIADGRDTTLEDHVNADYVRRDFTAVLKQNAAVVASTTQFAQFTRGGRVNVELDMTATAGGTAGTEIIITPTGLPAGILPGTFASAIGTFFYIRFASVIAGNCGWDGTNIFFYAGGSRTGQVGVDPSFAIAPNDSIIVNFSYLPDPQV